MRRRPSVRVASRNEPVLGHIRAIKAEHPFWGYRRVWAHLRYVDGLTVNKKRVLRLMQTHSLTVKRNVRLKARRTPSRSKPRPSRPNEWWGIDMTKVMTRRSGWVHLVVVVDWRTKKFVGHFAGRRCLSRHWLEALEGAVTRQFPLTGSMEQGLSVMSDNGSQPTSVAFMRSCHHLGIRQAFTSYGNPKGNADTERAIRTMKEELLWLREWEDEHEVAQEVGRWVERFNEHYLHSTLGYRTPNQVEHQLQTGPGTLLDAA